jgi:hypothetical protein
MFFVISLTLLINGNNLVPGLEWLIPGLEGLICSTGVGCSNMGWAYATRVCCMVFG